MFRVCGGHMNLVYGIGVNSGEYPAKVGGKHTKQYKLWQGMLSRCTEKVWNERPTYTGTTCSDNFKSYTFFYEWCQQQLGFINKDENSRCWHLDKDLLTKGNKVYSEDTCVFVPHRINLLLIKRDASRGDWPVGVSWRKKAEKFEASCSTGSKSQHLGFFDTPQEAFLAYKTFKEALIKEVAEDYKDQVDSRLYQALLNYKVEITD